LSRLGKIPVDIPAGVQVKVDGQRIEVKGPKGTVVRMVHPEIKPEVKEGKLHFTPVAEGDQVKALWGLNRMLAFNIVVGVSQGYRRELEIHGVGYKAELKGKDLQIAAGYSKPRLFKVPQGITFTVDNQTRVVVDGIDKELVGQTAAEIRKIRKPEPYKGKGIRYVGEHIRRKAGKIAGK
jgi:large subunit ribosomal protein L6